MLFVSLAALLALVASTQAFAIPEGTTNGVYAVTRDADGNDVHTRVAFADAAIEARDPGHELESRSKGEKWCGCTFNMNPGNADAAVTNLRGQLGAGATIPARKSFYAIHGDVVAFACSRSHGYGIPLSSARYAQALSDITSSCGRHIAGAQELQTNRGSPIIVGYQRYKKGDNFCSSSTTSSAKSC